MSQKLEKGVRYTRTTYTVVQFIVAIFRFSVTVFLMPGTNDAMAKKHRLMFRAPDPTEPRGALAARGCREGGRNSIRPQIHFEHLPASSPPFAKKNPFILFPRVAALAFMMKVGGQKRRPFTRRQCQRGRPIRRCGLQWPKASLTIHYRTTPPDTEREREREEGWK